MTLSSLLWMRREKPRSFEPSMNNRTRNHNSMSLGEHFGELMKVHSEVSLFAVQSNHLVAQLITQCVPWKPSKVPMIQADRTLRE
jgi:hypothetical protein